MSFQNGSNRVRRLYNLLSPAYNVLHRLAMPRSTRLAAQIKVLPAGKLLEVGTGTGLLLPLFKAHQVTAIDLSEKMLARARRQGFSNVELHQMDGACLDFPTASYDTVVMAHVLSVAPRPEALLAEAFRVLKPGGKLLIQNYFGTQKRFEWLQKLASPFHLRLTFPVEQLRCLSKFRLVRKERFGMAGIFWLLFLEKP